MFIISRTIWRMARSRLMAPVLVGVVIWQAWMTLRPKPFPLDERRSALADEAALSLAESLPVPSVGRPTVVVAPFQRDPTGAVTEAVRRAIERVDRYTVRPKTTLQNAYRELGIREQPLRPEDATAVAMEQIDGEYLLAGRVRVLSARSDRDEAMLEGVLVPVGNAEAAVPLSGTMIRDYTVEAESLPIQTYPWPSRLVGWIALVVLLPLVVAPVVSRGLARQSNGVNLLMLLGTTLVSGLAAYAMLGFRVDTELAAALLVGGSAVALAYNWSILAKLEELRQ